MSFPSIQQELLRSAVTTEGAFFSEERFLQWFAGQSAGCSCSVKQIPLAALKDWSFDEVTGNLAHVSMKGKLRGVRTTDGLPIFKPSMQDPTRYELDGTPAYFPIDGSIVASSSLMISGDWKQLVYAMRQDITYKLLDQAVIQDAAGNIIYNLAQQDMVALRAVMRLGFALPNPINRMNETAATRCAFAALTA